jgi:hypothetical protein
MAMEDLREQDRGIESFRFYLLALTLHRTVHLLELAVDERPRNLVGCIMTFRLLRGT